MGKEKNYLGQLLYDDYIWCCHISCPLVPIICSELGVHRNHGYCLLLCCLCVDYGDDSREVEGLYWHVYDVLLANQQAHHCRSCLGFQRFSLPSYRNISDGSSRLIIAGLAWAFR